MCGFILMDLDESGRLAADTKGKATVADVQISASGVLQWCRLGFVVSHSFKGWLCFIRWCCVSGVIHLRKGRCLLYALSRYRVVAECVG